MKKVLFSLILVLVLGLALEAFSFLAYVNLRSEYSIYSHKEAYLKTVNEEKFLEWIHEGVMVNKTLGWDLPVQYTEKIKGNCLGKKIKYSWENNARKTKDLVDGEEIIGLFGDSYAHGDEVDDEYTIASVLTSNFKLPTKNLGVGGYGPTQAILKFETMVENSKFKIAILQIMHENIRRMPNSFRPVFWLYTGGRFSFKPFTYNKFIHSLEYPNDWEQFQVKVNEAFENDYWRKPGGQFPYTFSFLKAASSNFVMLKTAGKILRPDYYIEYHFTQLKEDLEFLIHKFYSIAKKSNKVPVVLFVPETKSSYQVANKFSIEINSKYNEDFVFDAPLDGMNWDNYTLKKNACHPSKYGYSYLAKTIVDIVEEKGLFQSTRKSGV